MFEIKRMDKNEWIEIGCPALDYDGRAAVFLLICISFVIKHQSIEHIGQNIKKIYIMSTIVDSFPAL